MTIAAFRVAQNNDQLSTTTMSAEVLRFLVADSDSAIGHWIKKGRLARSADKIQMTPEGLAECQNTLLGLSGAYSTTEDKVREWVRRLTTGDHVTTRNRSFSAQQWAR